MQSNGAAKPGQRSKWRPEFSEALRDARIVILPDHDEADMRMPMRLHVRRLALPKVFAFSNSPTLGRVPKGRRCFRLVSGWNIPARN